MPFDASIALKAIVPKFSDPVDDYKNYLSLRDLVDQRKVRDMQMRRLQLQEQEAEREAGEYQRLQSALPSLSGNSTLTDWVKAGGIKHGIAGFKAQQEAVTSGLTRQEKEKGLEKTGNELRLTKGKVLRDKVRAAWEEDDDNTRAGMISGFAPALVDYGIVTQDQVNSPAMNRDQLGDMYRRLFIETGGDWDKHLEDRDKAKRDASLWQEQYLKAQQDRLTGEKETLEGKTSPAPALFEGWYKGWLLAKHRSDNPTNRYEATNEWIVQNRPQFPTPGVDVVRPQAVVQQEVQKAVDIARGTAEVSAGKVTPEATKRHLALKNLRSAVNAYREELKKTGPTFLPGKGARLGTLYTDMMLQQKEAAALGALTGPDMAIMEKMNADPTQLKGNWLGTGALLEQLGATDSIIGRSESNLFETYPGLNSTRPAGSKDKDPLGVR